MQATGVDWSDFAGILETQKEDARRTFGHGIAPNGLKPWRLAEDQKFLRYLPCVQDTPHLPLP